MSIDAKKDLLTATSTLRRRAADRLSVEEQAARPPLKAHERQKLVHELEVHKIELEMQNDELRHSQEELELSRNTYAEMYDFAPVSYFIFDANGVIREVNLTATQLLGIERQQLVNIPFSSFIDDAGGRAVFARHLALAMQRKVIQLCEISLTRKDGTIVHLQLQSIAKERLNDTTVYISTTITDITGRKLAEDELQKAHDNLEFIVGERTGELTRTNLQLTEEILERKKAEEALRSSYTEIKELKDRLLAENFYLRDEVARQFNFGEIVGQSPAIDHLFTQVQQVAPMTATVLLLGETGTGKGVIARAIHSSSARNDRPLITVNCTTLPATLAESELFGRERGAFTGSDARQIGRFELADNGTIFLDEIGEMPLELQSKLLRVIQDGEFERLGNPRTIKVDVRIIAASNRNLEEAVRNGRFREDLYYRLNVFPMTMPPLRQRKEDIPLLVNHFVAKFNKKIGKKIASVSKETLNFLQEYHWPGNVRELESVIERSIITSQGSSLQILNRFATSLTAEEPAGEEIRGLGELEHDHILQVLKKTGWRIEGKTGAALLLGLNPSTLRARIRKFGIRRT